MLARLLIAGRSTFYCCFDEETVDIFGQNYNLSRSAFVLLHTCC